MHDWTQSLRAGSALGSGASQDVKDGYARGSERETSVEGFLILTGVLLMLIGLVAMIEGNLHCLGIILRKKDRP
jgi:hypothetical protein